jgi:DNA polymerase III subunit delta'
MNRSNEKLLAHQNIFSLFERAFANGRLAHAYLVTGPSEVGKLQFALGLAQLVLGADRSLDSHPDYLFIERGDDPKTGKARAIIALDQIQGVRGKLSRRPMLNGWQAAVIRDAHLMNSSAANALLKTLEEPRDRTVLLLTALDSESVMPTIRSRCQEIRLNRISRAEIEQILLNRDLSKAQSGLLARLADGCPMRAMRLADQPDELDRLRELRRSALGMFGGDYASRWRIIEDVLPKKHSFQEAGERSRELLDVTAELLRDVLLIRNGQDERIIHVDAIDSLRRVADSKLNVTSALESLGRVRRQIAENVGPRKALVNFVTGF